MTYLSRKDLKDLRAEAIAGSLFAPDQVLAILDEIDRLIASYEELRQELDMRSLVERRSEPREAVAAQTLANLEGFAESVALKGGA